VAESVTVGLKSYVEQIETFSPVFSYGLRRK
jgi:hypothetical protein